MNEEYKEQMDAQEEQQLRVNSASEALRAAAEQKERTIHNENFLNELRKPDLDSEKHDWFRDEFPAWYSGAHAVANRHAEFDLEADLKMRNKRERAVAERRPGRLLRDRPFLRATMQDADMPPLEAFDEPDIPGSREHWHGQVLKADTVAKPSLSSKKQSQIYDGAEVATALMTLGADGKGIDSVSTVKTETTTKREETEEGAASRVGRWME
jgi:hypothetical protein